MSDDHDDRTLAFARACVALDAGVQRWEAAEEALARALEERDRAMAEVAQLKEAAARAKTAFDARREAFRAKVRAIGGETAWDGSCSPADSPPASPADA